MELLRAPLWEIRQIILSANKKQVIDADQSEGSFTSQQWRTKPPSACTNEGKNKSTVSNLFRAPLVQVHEDSVRH